MLTAPSFVHCAFFARHCNAGMEIFYNGQMHRRRHYDRSRSSALYWCFATIFSRCFLRYQARWLGYNVVQKYCRNVQPAELRGTNVTVTDRQISADRAPNVT